MESSEEAKTLRKVRFTLPEEEELGRPNAVRGRVVTNSQKQLPAIQKETVALKVDEHKVHGTARYINGTLNFSTTDYKSTPSNNDGATERPKESQKSESHRFRPKLLTSCLSSSKKKPSNKADSDHSNKSATATGIHSAENPNRKDILPKLNSLSKALSNQIQTATSKASPPKKKVKKSKARRFIFFSPACIKRKKPKLMCAPTRRKRKIGDQIPDTLNVPAFKAMQKLRYHIYENDRDPKHNIVNEQLRKMRIQQIEDDRCSNCSDETEALIDVESNTDSEDYNGSDSSDSVNKWKGISVNDLSQAQPLSRDGSFGSFTDFVQRWRRVQRKSVARINQWKRKQSTAAVDSSGFKNPDANS